MDSTARLAEKFHREGYLILDDCIPLPSLCAVKTLLSSSSAEIGKVLRERGIGDDNVESFLAKPPADLDASEYSELKALVSGNFPRNIKAHPALWDLLGGERLTSVLKRILGAERLYLHMFPSPRHVAPSSVLAAVPRHVDRQYNGHMSNFVTVWVPVEAFSENMGGVRVFPKSHNVAHNPEIDESARLENDLWFAPIRSDLGDGVLATVTKGSALLLHRDLVHESALNLSGYVRLSADLRVFGDQDSTTKHYLDLQEKKIFEPLTGERHV